MNDEKRQHIPSMQVSRRKGGFRFLKRIALLFVFFLIPAIPHLIGLKISGPPSTPADAVFVLSGGEGRIAEGFRAWKAGAGHDLYILGAGRNTKPSQLLPGMDTLPAKERSRIRVEGWSENTLENAFSAKAVTEDRKYLSVILVTSDYHIPRAYHAFRKVLSPDVAISVLRVHPESSRPGAVWRWARRHFIEGWKYWGYWILLLWE